MEYNMDSVEYSMIANIIHSNWFDHLPTFNTFSFSSFAGKASFFRRNKLYNSTVMPLEISINHTISIYLILIQSYILFHVGTKNSFNILSIFLRSSL